MIGAHAVDGGSRGELMTAAEALQTVQFVTIKERRFAVLSAEDWEALVEWVEVWKIPRLCGQRFAVEAAGGDDERAGWLTWDEADKELWIAL